MLILNKNTKKIVIIVGIVLFCLVCLHFLNTNKNNDVTTPLIVSEKESSVNQKQLATGMVQSNEVKEAEKVRFSETRFAKQNETEALNNPAKLLVEGHFDLAENLVLSPVNLDHTKLIISYHVTDHNKPTILRIGELDQSGVPQIAIDIKATKETVNVETDGIITSVTRHYVVVNGLIEGKDYLYQIGDGIDFGSLHKYHVPSQSEEGVIAFFGDLQGYKKSQYEAFKTIFDEVNKQNNIQANVFAGDIVDNGSLFQQWEYFFNSIDSYSDSRIMISALGNHDFGHAIPFFNQGFKPWVNSNDISMINNQVILSNNVLLLTWDTELAKTFDQQAIWISEQIRNNPHQYAIILMHRSCYPMRYDEPYIRKLAAFFQKEGIDLVLSGHDHIYSRTTMFDDLKVGLNEGVTFVCGGSGSGSKFYDFSEITGGRYWKDVLFDKNQPVYSILKVNGNGLDFKAYSVENGKHILIDQFVLKH